MALREDDGTQITRMIMISADFGVKISQVAMSASGSKDF
jgi:hypothetical protein